MRPYRNIRNFVSCSQNSSKKDFPCLLNCTLPVIYGLEPLCKSFTRGVFIFVLFKQTRTVKKTLLIYLINKVNSTQKYGIFDGAVLQDVTVCSL